MIAHICLVTCYNSFLALSQRVSAEAQEQLETKDRIIQKLAANNKDKDNLIAVSKGVLFYHFVCCCLVQI